MVIIEFCEKGDIGTIDDESAGPKEAEARVNSLCTIYA